MAAPFTTFPVPATYATAEWGLPVNVKDFGAVGDGVTDDSTAIQNAIDYAIANNFRAVFLPDGGYRTTRTIFVDHPASVRGIGVLPAWAVGTTYALNDKVTNNGMVWKSLTAGNLGHTPELRPGANFTAGGNWTAADSGAAANGKFVFWEPSFSTPSHAEGNLAFIGPPGQARTEARARILPNFNNAPGVILGSGNGMLMASIGVGGGRGGLNDATDGGTVNNGVYSGAQRWAGGLPSMGVGIALAGTGGNSRCFLDRVGIEAFYNGILTGYCGDGLGDFNIVRDPFIFNCYNGINIHQTQNFINDVYNGLVSSIVNVSATLGTGCNCVGGNYGTMFGQAPACSFLVNTITYVDDFHLTAVISTASPTTFNGVAMLDYLKTGQMDTFVAETVHFGHVRLHPTAFNNGTSTMTFELDDIWSKQGGEFGYTNLTLAATFDLMTEIAACTKFYATTLCTSFQGTGINAYNMHIENTATTTFFDTSGFFSGALPCSAKGILFNGPLGFIFGMPTANDGQKALYAAQMVVPFVLLNRGSLFMESCSVGGADSECAFNLDWDFFGTRLTFKMTNCSGFSFNPRVAGGPGSAQSIANSLIGGGEFDKSPFVLKLTGGTGVSSSGNAAGPDWVRALGQAPCWGVRPAPWATPMILKEHLTALMAPLTPIAMTGTSWLFDYPILWGGQMYAVDAEILNDASPPLHRRVMSQHTNGYSYGQSLPINWNCKGQSAIINVDDVSLLFPGLGITVTIATSQDLMIKGVYSYMDTDSPGKQAGYILVTHPFDDGDIHTPPIKGTKSTVYTGATIAQQAFNLKFFDSIDRWLDDAPVVVASLPAAASNKGARRLVNNATATTMWSIVAGGGAITVPVISDGTNWRIG